MKAFVETRKEHAQLPPPSGGTKTIFQTYHSNTEAESQTGPLHSSIFFQHKQGKLSSCTGHPGNGTASAVL